MTTGGPLRSTSWVCSLPVAVEYGVDDVLDVLRNLYALDGEIVHDEFRILCPNPKHEDTHPSCDVNLRTGLWNCFSCGATGDLASLGRLVLGKPTPAILKLLRPNEPTAIAAAIQRRVKLHRECLVEQASSVIYNKSPLSPGLSRGNARVEDVEVRFPKDLLRRGFTPRTLRSWNVQTVASQEFPKQSGNGTFEITNAIGIPILNEAGKMLLWCYRATKKSAPWFQKMRYLYTPGSVDLIKQTWFGLNHSGDADEIVVVEGALDAMWLWQWGIPAVAILGSHFTDFRKLDRLNQFRRVVIFTDHDGAGETAALALAESLRAHGTPGRIVLYPRWAKNREGRQASDPQEVCGLDLELMVERAIPLTTWAIRRGDKLREF